MSKNRETAVSEVKAIMLREIDAMRRSRQAAPSRQKRADSGPLERQLGSSLGVLNTLWQVGPDAMRSSRVVIGRVLNFLRKVGYWATRPYLLSLAANQSRINAQVTNVLNHLVPVVDEMQLSLTGQAQLQELVELHKQEMDRLSKRVQDLEQRLAESAAPDGLDRQYYELQERFRGDEATIRTLQKSYLKYFSSCQNVLDVGCGRGEFLSLLKEEGISAYGVDLNSEMVRLNQQRGLLVIQADGTKHLRSLPDGSLDGIFAAHVIEHMPVVELQRFLTEAFRALQPGGKLVLETPNVSSPVVLGRTYYRDWTHCQPIHPDTVQTLVELVGFKVSAVTYSAPLGDREALLLPVDDSGPWAATLNGNFQTLNQLVFGYQNYTVVAVKPA